nr:aminopeptidase P family protein [Haloplasma contractile]
MITIEIKERIQKLRTLMEEKGLAAYIVPSSDPHQSEYVAEHYASRAFISGFTGSAGTAVITLDEAGLWTDGRYFVQAADELKGTGVRLFKMGESGVPTISDFLKKLPKESKIGFDGKVIAVNYFNSLNKSLAKKGFTYSVNDDLMNDVWDDRPEIPTTPVITHETVYTGKSREEKIKEVVSEMKTLGASHYVISGLDDIAWLYNIRGRDIRYNPLTIAYTVLTEEKAYLFIDDNKISDKLKAELEQATIEIRPYNSIKEYFEKLNEGLVILDPSKTNIWLHSAIKIKKLPIKDITTRLKGIKNETEIEHVRNCMVRDGVAMVKYMKWLKETIKERTIKEIEASDKLADFRSTDELFFDFSFPTISAYKENAALPHYRATEEKQATIKPESLYLVDSGGQYLDGTTDITRTIAMGPLTEEEKTDFTLVLKGMIDLTLQRFLYGTTGSKLDIIARIPLWNAGLDYKHGTGHGVGFFLNVHEGPHSIGSRPNTVKIEKGMIMSNEPGVYKAGKHGIRIENIIVAQEDIKTEFGGQFMKFETVTLCPIDLDAIDASLLSKEEKTWLNAYHREVFEKLSPYLNEEEQVFLKEYTKEI